MTSSERYKHFLRQSGCSTQTIQTYVPRVERALTSGIGVNTQAQDLLAYTSGMPPGTVRHVLDALKSYYQWLILLGECSNNPVISVPYPRAVAKIPESYTPLELKTIFNSAQGRVEGILRFLYYTGSRVGEAVGVKPEDVTELGVRLTETKHRPLGGRHERFIPLGRPGLQAIQLLVSNRGYTTARGEEYLLGVVRSTVEKYCRELSAIVGFRVYPHKFRATFATDLLQKGVDIRTVQELLGHTSLNTTMRYTAVTSEGKRSAIGLLT